MIDDKMIISDKLYVLENFFSSPNKVTIFVRHDFLTSLNVLFLYSLELWVQFICNFLWGVVDRVCIVLSIVFISVQQ